MVKRSLVLALLAALLAAPVALAVEPEDAGALWTSQFGEGAASIEVNPRLPLAGEQFVATLTLDAPREIVNVTYQMCDVGDSCFVLGLPVEPGANGTWVLDTRNEQLHSKHFTGLRVFDAGQRIGWQYFLEYSDGSIETFPHGDTCNPQTDTDEEWLICQESHYFAVDIQAAKSTPTPGLLVLVAALLIAGRRNA